MGREKAERKEKKSKEKMRSVKNTVIVCYYICVYLSCISFVYTFYVSSSSSYILNTLNTLYCTYIT